MPDTFIDIDKINSILNDRGEASSIDIDRILTKGRELKGLSPEEAAVLLKATDRDVVGRIFDTASFIKEKIYGDRLVLFAPLYLSSYCLNDCVYCGFHAGNQAPRKRLSIDEIKEQVKIIIGMGHKRLLVESGEDPDENSIEYILDAIDAIYSVRVGNDEIRRVNVNIAATSVENYGLLKSREIGTYQLFQETYHRPTYETMHRGPKGDFNRQLYAMDRAFEGGLDDVGIGVLFGLYDWRFELLALITHAEYLTKKFGIGPHTISVPRFRPANGVDFIPPFPVSDDEFLRLIAILRIAVPYTGMIITTRETPAIREKAFRIGISQASAASSTSPGGFGRKEGNDAGQFELADKRGLDEVALSVMMQGMTPSFCTACYRNSRTGSAFMELAKPGDIQEFCRPNSILTLMEYLEDHASEEGKTRGLELIKKELGLIENPSLKGQTEERLQRIKRGERDLYF